MLFRLNLGFVADQAYIGANLWSILGLEFLSASQLFLGLVTFSAVSEFMEFILLHYEG